MPGAPHIRHLSLDLWLTLIRSNPAFKPARNALFIKYFGLQQPEEKVLNLFQEYDRLFNSINESTGRNLSRNEMLYIILAALGKDIREIGVSELEAFWIQAEDLFFKWPPEVLDDGVPDVLSQIQNRGISISLLSNTAFITGATLRKLLPSLGFEHSFHFQVYSDEEERSKPSPEIYNIVYNKAAQMAPFTGKEILHVGDNAVADFDGALRAGFQAILFNPNEQKLSATLAATLCTPPLPCTT